MLGEDDVLLSQLASLNRVAADHFLLLEMQRRDILLVLLFLVCPFIGRGPVLGELLFELRDQGNIVFLLAFKPFSVLLLALSRAKSMGKSGQQIWEKLNGRMRHVMAI